MLFSEIYGSYFNVVAAILTEAARGCLTERRMTQLIQEKAFAESGLSIPLALKSEAWPLVDQTFHTVIRHEPTMPLTTLQRRWMKALLSDPRIALFAPDASGLDDVRPLYTQGTFILFDQYTDGDPYGEPGYIARFRLILEAIRTRRGLRVWFRGRNGARHSFACMPCQLEYSQKDDKFRLLAVSARRGNITVNLGRIFSCALLEGCSDETEDVPAIHLKELILLLRDERNALERVLLHFSHFEKETLKLDDRLYQIKLRYDEEDETELLIRILSFGPVLEVKAPDTFIQLIRERIDKQLCFPQTAGDP